MNAQNPTLPEDFGRTWIILVRTTLLDAADALGDLDRRVGDGDFGANIRTAMRPADENITTDEPDTYRDWVTCMSRAWLGVGGTSGPLLGMFFRDLAKAADGPPQTLEGRPDAASGRDAPSLAQLADALTAGQGTVQKYGEAEVGDKTMVDAMDPAVIALRTALDAQEDAAAALARAEQAAVEAARSTADATARRGRASYVGEASRGVMDPGAAAIALVIGAARAAAATGSDVDTSWVR